MPIELTRSTDGGRTWRSQQISSSTVNATNAGRDGCTVRTDSRGVVYVMWRGEDPRTHVEGQILTRSFDGGASFDNPRRVTGPAGPVGVIDPLILRPVEDGLAGARADLAPAPSLDVANGAPTGAGATDELVLTWVDGSPGLNDERALLSTSMDQGRTFSSPVRYDKVLPS